MAQIAGLLVLVCVLSAMAQEFHPEDPCSRKGGICVAAKSCPNSRLENGLCPEQQAAGAECCHEVPASDKRCTSHGGECIENCPSTITRSDLSCPSGTSCCIWL